MKISLPTQLLVGLPRVIGAAFAAVIMLTAFAQPVAANALTAHGNDVYEGHDLKVRFTVEWSASSNFHLRYKYKTQDGSATSSGRWRDYEPTSGYVRWLPFTRNPVADVIVETAQDQLCEYDETVKVILYDPQWTSSLSRGWGGFCPNTRGYPCQFEAEFTIKQHEDGCTAGTFGE